MACLNSDLLTRIVNKPKEKERKKKKKKRKKEETVRRSIMLPPKRAVKEAVSNRVQLVDDDHGTRELGSFRNIVISNAVNVNLVGSKQTGMAIESCSLKQWEWQ